MSFDLSVAVFCQNEAARIEACLGSIAAAAQGLRVRVSVIVNGSSDGSADLAERALELPGEVYRIAAGDKSNAINRSLYDLRVPARHYMFVDGYATLAPSSLHAMMGVLDAEPHANAVAGVPGNGRTVAAIRADTLAGTGRLNGQLYALRGDFVARLSQAGYRLPLKLYRGDGLLGSMLCHDLDPIGHSWDGARIAGCGEAVFGIASLTHWKPADLRRQFRRSVRQMRGRLENAAIRAVIYRQGYAGLPEDADDMIAAWLAAGGTPVASPLERPFMMLALRQHRLALLGR